MLSTTNTIPLSNMINRGVITLLTLIMLASPALQADEIKGFQDFKGKPQLLTNYTGKGKWLVVMFWASDCHVCNVKAHTYVDFHMVHSDKDATVLGISVDGKEKLAEAKKFISKHHIDFPNLVAEYETAANMYAEYAGESFKGTPSIMIFSPEGEIKAAAAGAVPAEMIANFIARQSAQKAAVEK